jgi:hypothetical protein
MKRLGKSLEDDEAFQSVEIVDDQLQPQQQQQQQQQQRQQTYEPSNLNRGAVVLSAPLAQQGEGQQEGLRQEQGNSHDYQHDYDSDSDTILRKLSGGVPAAEVRFPL